MRFLYHILFIPTTLSKLIFNVKLQKKYVKRSITALIKENKIYTDGSITEKDIYKIINYYGMGVPAILGTAFSLLRESPMTEAERRASTFLGAMTGLGDDFFEMNNGDEKHLYSLLDALLNTSSEYKPQNSREKLFLDFFTEVINNTTEHSSIKHYIKKVFETQILTLNQKNIGITDDEIEKITLNKGGYSLLLYRSLFFPLPDEKEQALLFKMGGLMQMGNDIFDIYKDHQDGIHTLVTRCQDINILRKSFYKLMSDTIKSAYETKFKNKNIQKFNRFILLGICRVYVCLDQYEKLQKKHNNSFNIKLYSRKDLICDMEKMPNIFKSIYYYLKYA